MTFTKQLINSNIGAYIESISLREPDILRKLREETAKLPNAIMQITPEQGQFMGLLTQLIQAKYALEIGTFTGYSSICIASHLQPNGEMICCDNSPEWTDIAKRYWEKAGLQDRMHLKLAPATQTLDELIQEGKQNHFDIAFIDADKISYDTYYEKCLELVRPGGLILLDNTLQQGYVIDPKHDEPAVRSIRALNQKLFSDDRVDISLLPIADGLTMVLKR